MKLIQETRSSVAVVVVPGDSLGANNVAEFKREMEVLTRTSKRVVIDLSEVQFIDSAGCGALLQYQRLLQQQGGALVVCGITAPVRALFELVRIQRVLDVYLSREQAIQALQGELRAR